VTKGEGVAKETKRLEDFTSLIAPMKEEVAKFWKETTKRTNQWRMRKVKFPEIYFCTLSIIFAL
jgi:hypothetical protein